MDRLVKCMSHLDMISIVCIDSTELVDTARKIHKMNPTPTAALGRLLSMTAMMGSTMKDNGKVTTQIIGNGPVGSLLAVSDNKAHVKGYAKNPLAEAELSEEGKLNVKAIIGKGQLNVIKDIGLKEPYVGSIPLRSGEIAEDFTYYYAISEQIPTAIALGVLVDTDGTVKRAGGYILQVLPDTPNDIIALIENRIQSSATMTQMLENEMSLEDIAKYISDDLDTRVVEEIVPRYECDCSRERIERAIISMGKKDIEELAEDEKTTVECQFCNRKYEFTKKEIESLLR